MTSAVDSSSRCSARCWWEWRSSPVVTVAVTAQLGPTSVAELEAREDARDARLDAREERVEELQKRVEEQQERLEEQQESGG
jgi:hypothetical protein